VFGSRIFKHKLQNFAKISGDSTTLHLLRKPVRGLMYALYTNAGLKGAETLTGSATDLTADNDLQETLSPTTLMGIPTETWQTQGTKNLITCS